MSEVRPIADAEKNKDGKRRMQTNIDFELRSGTAQRVLIGILSIVIIFFCVYQIYVSGRGRSTATTETALPRTISKNIDTRGYVLREESVVPYAGSGTVVPGTANGSKVSVGDAVAKIYTSPDMAEKSLEYAYLQEELAYYKNIDLVSGSVLSVGMELYNANILSSLLAVENTLDQNKLSGLPERIRALSADITKKQAAIGKTIDVSGRISMLTGQLETLENELAGYSEITASQAGYYVNVTDGYETVGDYSAVSAVTPEEVDALLNAAPAHVEKNVGKLITQFNWYLLCNVNEADADALTIGANVKVFFPDISDEALTMRLKAKNFSGDGTVALVLSSNMMNALLASLRLENVRIRVEEYSGYAVNKKAVRTVKNADGEDEIGVFIQLGNIARFRKIEIIYSDENIVLVSNTDQNGYLRLYDEIITEGTDLYDGKIIS